MAGAELRATATDRSLLRLRSSVTPLSARNRLIDKAQELFAPTEVEA
jgi:hypothetical protein